MPRIMLKPGSPEYADEEELQTEVKVCDMKGCAEFGEHKAPKHRGLNEYHFFCMEHVREYNKAWNYFSGMADSEIEDHVLKSMLGDRPTWKFRPDGATPEDMLRSAAWKSYHFSESTTPNESADIYSKTEIEAMAVLGLTFSADFEEVKKRFKELAKKYHPDLNAGDKSAEESFKKINMAYTILKVTYDTRSAQF